MTSFITIELLNFKCWYNKSITLYEGINYFSGESGSGKSTINKAIQFTLYGGRKWKNIQNREHKNEPIKVSIYYESSNMKWKITRARPHENVTVELQDINGYFTYNGEGAQDWINKQFGIENIWLSASYISRKKPHFLLDASNSDKMELLQHIAYGDSSAHNQPEYYLQPTKNQLTIYNENFKKLNDNIRIYQGMRLSLINKNPILSTFKQLSDSEFENIIEQKRINELTLEQLKVNLLALQTKRQFKYQLDNLPRFDRSEIDLINELEMLKIKQKKYILGIKLQNFDIDILNIDMTKLETDHFLYTKYQKEGWLFEIKSLNEWLDECKNNLRIWNEQQEINNKNIQIENSNKKKSEINESLLKEYKRNLEYYQSCKDKYDKYIKIKMSIESKLEVYKSYNQNLEYIDIQISYLQNMISKLNYESLLINFDIRVLEIDKNIVLNDKFLYGKYESFGWNKNISLAEWIQNIKEKITKYELQKQLEIKNIQIEEANKIKMQLFTSEKREYERNLIDYNNYLIQIEKYNKTKNEFKDINYTIEDIENETIINENKKLKLTYQQYLNGFDKRVLNIQDSIINRYINLYEHYKLCGWNENISLLEWINYTKNKIAEYDHNEYNKKKNKEIEDNNKQKELYNTQLKSKYNLQLTEYNIIINEIEEYNKKQKELNQLYEQIMNEQLNKLDDNDDLTHQWITGFKIGLNISLEELICPNCNHGIIYKNGKLELGNIRSNDSKKRIKELILLCDIEYNKRINRENIINKKKEFDKIIPKNQPNLPENPQLLELDNLIEVKNLNKPNLNIFEIPEIDYDSCLNMLKYYSYIDIYYKDQKLDIIVTESIDELNIISNSLLMKKGILIRKKEFENTNQPIEIKLLQEPIEPKLESLIKFEVCIKPELNIFDIPQFNYSDCYNLLSSYNLIDIYNKNKNLNIDIIGDKQYIENQINILLHLKSLIKEREDFNKIEIPILVEQPEEVKLLEMDKLIPIININKPSLDIFDLPNFDFVKYKNLMISKDLVNYYNEYIGYKVIIEESIKNIETKIENINNTLMSMEKIKKEKERLESLILTFPEDDNNIEIKINELTTSISNFSQIIILNNEMKEINKVDAIIVQLNNELKSTIDIISHLNYFYNQIEELGVKALENRIENINGPLKEILDDLFKEDINVKISPYKELKNGNNKLQINFQIEHKSSKVDDANEDLSDGEEGRLSIGLLLALSRTNNNPFVIIDEVLSSMHQEKQNSVLEIIPIYAPGKFVISICHGISENGSNNVIYF